ncbi:hypothetical protein KAR91_17545 [Candidatus Pacearchaeota archaeon]|nr:hypothetical protein [Candidatus Pacearchaeota archaeon]
MKIKTRLTIIMISTISVILMFLATQFFVTKLMQKNIVQESILEEITDGIFKLDVFTYDYLLYRTERAYEQWWLMHNKIRKLFATLKFQIKEHKDIWDDIITGHKILGDIFSRLLVEYKESITYKEGANIFKEIENRLIGQLLQESQLIVSKVSQLNIEFEEQTHNKILLFNMISILFFAILFIIIRLFHVI